MNFRSAASLLGVMALAACQYPAVEDASKPQQWSMEDVAFAQASCGGCHAVEKGALSPNPRSPSFVDIAERRGVTESSLATYLRDAHNYPEAMDFDLTEQQADALAHYMMTLRD